MTTVLLIVLALGILLSVGWYTFRLGISPMPTSQTVKKTLLEQLPPDIKGTIYELGCGWGTLLFPLGKKYPDSVVKGYELSPLPYLFCKCRQWVTSQENVALFRQDFMSTSISDAGLVVCYLYPGAMAKLKDKFEKELPSGCWIISNTFALPQWTPDAVYSMADLYRTKIYLYRKP